MKNLKRNQIIIFVIALMLVSAGYLNYTTTEDTEQTSTALNYTDYSSIGDAKLVSSNAVKQTNTINENEEVEQDEENIQEENVTQTSNTASSDGYFSSSRLTRDTMYSQMIETYEKILENENISSDQKTIAQTEIKNISDNKNKIMICENLIKTKEIEDVVIFINGESVSVVVKSEMLGEEQIAQIQNIISREMNVEITNIHISNK
jgi:stage III sporulation protein AH